MSKRSETAASMAMWSAVAMIAFQVGGKATRDALFLSSFDVSALPVMVMGAALASIAVVLGTSRAMTALAPARLVPAAFAASALFLMAEWALLHRAPKLTAVLVYLHMASLGSVLISGFWSVVSERFDPRTAKKQIGRIGGGATLGGLVGGLVAERVAATFGIWMMLPILAALHLFCAWMTWGLRPPAGPASPASLSETTRPAFRILKEVSYLRSLAAVVLLGAVSAMLTDYVFKAQATASYGRGASLLRFFGLFYSAVGLATFLVQTAFSRLVLEKLGLAKAVGSLPFAVGAGGLSMLFAPGIGTAGIARGMEMVLRGSLFRSGYELLFTPIPPKEKRATKSIIDVGFERLGDGLGGGVVRLMLLLGPALSTRAMLASAIFVAILGLWIASRMNQAYVRALEKSLLNRAVELEISEIQDSTTRSAVLGSSVPAAAKQAAAKQPKPVNALEPGARRLQQLRSGDPAVVRRALEQEEPLDPLILGSHVIPLLAWDEVADDAIRVLCKAAPRIIGQLTDTLLDQEREFAIRRRVPKVLATCATQRAAEGLVMGLADKRFEVRFQCGRALDTILSKDPRVRLTPQQVFDAVMREVSVSEGVWESHRLLDRMEDSSSSPFVNEFLRDRTSRSLEHVFTLLSLVLPKDPLKIAYKGLHTNDDSIRGTALEYLESVLPADIREHLWPFLEDRRSKERPTRSREEILADLMRSNQSVVINLAELRKKFRADAEG